MDEVVVYWPRRYGMHSYATLIKEAEGLETLNTA